MNAQQILTIAQVIVNEQVADLEKQVSDLQAHIASVKKTLPVRIAEELEKLQKEGGKVEIEKPTKSDSKKSDSKKSDSKKSDSKKAKIDFKDVFGKVKSKVTGKDIQDYITKHDLPGPDAADGKKPSKAVLLSYITEYLESAPGVTSEKSSSSEGESSPKKTPSKKTTTVVVSKTPESEKKSDETGDLFTDQGVEVDVEVKEVEKAMKPSTKTDVSEELRSKISSSFAEEIEGMKSSTSSEASTSGESTSEASVEPTEDDFRAYVKVIRSGSVSDGNQMDISKQSGLSEVMVTKIIQTYSELKDAYPDVIIEAEREKKKKSKKTLKTRVK